HLKKLRQILCRGSFDSQFFANDLRTVCQRLKLHFRDHACQRLHAAIRAQRYSLGRNGSNNLADASSDFLGRFNRICADIQDADLNVLILGKVFQEVDARHVAVRVIQDKLIDAFCFEEVWENSLIALWIRGTENIVAPRISETEVPTDLCIDPIAELLDDFTYPL